ncbi:hypothetical protein BYT27DRAFT_7223258 [Phlegmacium glaucopus]|nr:hypothetical protein BYT27DRAFT_7223258 [Phlegmacium glaucopus]
MTVIPLSSATIHVVLDHICPLSAPLPPHIISTPLRQRHHFLALTPSNPIDYLAWPSQNQSHAVNLLQSIPVLPSHDLLFPVQYTADLENVSAYARITSDINLVFIWSATEGWQYHNVALMPFPANSYASLTDAMALYSADDFLPEQHHTINVADDDDHSYWDSYGQGEVSDSISGATLDPDPSSEDAYWAQYSGVQGSGDSTLPSPMPRKKVYETDVDPMPERIIVPSDDLQLHHIEPYNPLEPLSPETLARRLAALSSRSGANSPPSLDDSPDSETPSPNLGEVSHNQTSSSPSISHQQLNEPVIMHPQSDSDDRAQSALRDSIRSLYHFWKLSRPGRPSDQDKTLFLSTVYQVIDQL